MANGLTVPLGEEVISYYINAQTISLSALQTPIEEADLIPSWAPLHDEIGTKVKALEHQGITHLEGLPHELKTTRRLDALAAATDVDKTYLILLRREEEKNPRSDGQDSQIIATLYLKLLHLHKLFSSIVSRSQHMKS